MLSVSLEPPIQPAAVLTSLPSDLRPALCWHLFTDESASLPSFFITCKTTNTWRQPFLREYEGRIKRWVRHYPLDVRREMVRHAFGKEPLPQRIVALLGKLEFGQHANNRPLLNSLPFRLPCNELVILYPNGNRSFLSAISTRCPPFLRSLHIQSKDMTDALLNKIAERCVDLFRLELTHCPQITFAGTTRWESLSVLHLKECMGLANDESFTWIAARCPSLTTITLYRAVSQEIDSVVTKVGG